MRQMKKKIIIAIIVTLLLTATFAFVIGYLVVKDKNETISDLNTRIADSRCLAFATDLDADSIITQEDIIEVDLKLSSLAGGSYFYKKEGAGGERLVHYVVSLNEEGVEQVSYTGFTKNDLVGRVVKANVSAKTPILDSLLYAKGEEPTKDERLQEFNFIQIPSDLNANDYIDIRIQFPTGEDYSVLIGKKVEKIAGDSTIFIKLNEEEIMAMGSAIIEAYMQKGVRLYANKYTDPATQLIDEKIVDYVAKFDYAVEKLMNEKINFELQKLVVEKFQKDGLYTEVDAAALGLDSKIAGMIKYTANSGDTIFENGEEIVLKESRVIDLYVEKTEEKELLIEKESWALVTTAIKDELLEENPELFEISLEDLENEILATYAGIEEDYIGAIKVASLKGDEDTLNYYKAMRVETRTEIIRSYPVKEEVLAVIKNNPNLLATVIAEFDTVALTNTKIDEYKQLEAQYNAAYDEYTKQEIKEKMDEILDERTENIEKSLEEEIAAQKAQRVSYLESLINGEV